MRPGEGAPSVAAASALVHTGHATGVPGPAACAVPRTPIFPQCWGGAEPPRLPRRADGAQARLAAAEPGGAAAVRDVGHAVDRLPVHAARAHDAHRAAHGPGECGPRRTSAAGVGALGPYVGLAAEGVGCGACSALDDAPAELRVGVCMRAGVFTGLPAEARSGKGRPVSENSGAAATGGCAAQPPRHGPAPAPLPGRHPGNSCLRCQPTASGERVRRRATGNRADDDAGAVPRHGLCCGQGRAQAPVAAHRRAPARVAARAAGAHTSAPVRICRRRIVMFAPRPCFSYILCKVTGWRPPPARGADDISGMR